MLGIDKQAARYAWTVVVLVLLLALFYVVRKTLFIFVVALLLAYLLSPLVNLLDRVLPTSRTRTPALALAYVIFLAVLVVGGMQIGSRVVEQANAFVTRFPEMLANWEQPSQSVAPGVNSVKQQILQKIREQVKLRSNDVIAAIPKAGLKFLTVASDLIYVIVVPILAFFFLRDGRVIRQHFLDMIEEGPRRALVDDLMADVHLLLAHYMRALLLLCLATFLSYSIFFAAMGVPYGVMLAALAFVLEFIPMLGPLTAAVVILIVAAISGSHVLAVLIFLGVYRMFQDYVLSPHLMGSGVELHPLLVLFGVFAGAEVAGVPGTFLSVPVLALLRIVYRRMRKVKTRLTPQPTI